MTKLLLFLHIVAIFVAAVVNGQEENDDSYSSWFDESYDGSYYRPYYGNYYSIPPSASVNEESRSEVVPNVEQVERLWVGGLMGLRNTLANAAGETYLDWRCWPGYNNQLTGRNKGHNRAILVASMCHRGPCAKTCLLKRHGLLSEFPRRVPPEEHMIRESSGVSVFFNENGRESAKEIARRIWSNCKQEAQAIEDYAEPRNEAGCSYELEDCVQKHTNCPIDNRKK